jgi:chitodextrinase
MDAPMRQISLSRFFTSFLVVALLAAATVAVIAATPNVTPAAAQAATDRPNAPAPVDMRAVSNTPARGHWGVTGLDPNRTVNFETPVWDFAVIGDRIYVGGAFLNVQRDRNATPISRPYLAAFDLRSGAWDPGFQPDLNGSVYALEVTSRGTLLVGGEFTSVDGDTRVEGLTALDPVTGRRDTQFIASVQRPWATEKPVVRSLEVVGSDLYVAGNFSHVRTGTRRAASLTPLHSSKCLYPLNGSTADGTFIVQRTCQYTSIERWVVSGTQIVHDDSGKCAQVSGTAAGTRAVLQPCDGGSDQQFARISNNRWQVASTGLCLNIAGASQNDNAELIQWFCGNASNEQITYNDAIRTRASKVARVSADRGVHDTTFRPEVTGAGVWGFGIDTVNNMMHLAGFFSAVGGGAGTRSFASVDLTTGTLRTDLTPLRRNNTRQLDMYDVEVGAGKIWAGGSEHIVHVLDAATRNLLGWHSTGYRSPDNFNWDTRNFFIGGGDYQVVEEVGNFILAGCHCNREELNGVLSHYSSFDNARFRTLMLEAYDSATGRLVSNFVPDLAQSIEGAWAVHSDGLGCLLVGGDFELAGLKTGSAFWVGNWARFCPPGVDVGPDTISPSIPTGVTAVSPGAGGDDSVTVSWTASTDNRAVASYDIYRNGVVIGNTTGTTFTDDGLAAGVSFAYRVQAIDTSGNRSAGSPPINVTVAGADVSPPSIPVGLAATVEGSNVTLTWTASTDNRGVTGYAVFRNGAYIGWANGTTFTNTGVPIGTYNYTLRAFDAANNRSDRSAPLSVTVGGADTEPPTSPTGLAGTVDGSTVTLTWNASTDNRGVTGYAVYRNGAYIGWANGTTFTNTGVPDGQQSYTLRAFDAANNRSDLTPAFPVTVGGPDTELPSVPTGLTAEVNGSSVILTWSPSTDNRGVTGYAVFRNGAYIGWATGTTFANVDVPAGTYNYTLRAFDAANNRSDRSAPLSVTVG